MCIQFCQLYRFEVYVKANPSIFVFLLTIVAMSVVYMKYWKTYYAVVARPWTISSLNMHLEA